jgi:hypothetical protein
MMSRRLWKEISETKGAMRRSRRRHLTSGIESLTRAEDGRVDAFAEERAENRYVERRGQRYRRVAGQAASRTSNDAPTTADH